MSIFSIPASLTALRHRNFRLYFYGQAISLIGTWMQRIAISWLVYKMTQSAFMLGLVAFAGQIPILFLSPYAGAFTDRHSRYKTLLFTQVASMVQAGVLALAVFLDAHNIGLIIGLSILLGIINAFDTPSRQSLMIYMVEDKRDLPNAIALNSTMVTLARLLGPVVAGVILNYFGEDVCFLVNFLSFIAVLASLFMMKILEPVRPPNTGHIWDGLKEGYSYLKKNQAIRSVILLTAMISFFVMPYTTLLPIYATMVFKGDVTTFSWLNSFGGFGALMGAFFMAFRKQKGNLLKLITYAATVFSAGLVLFSYTGNLFLALFIIVFAEAGMLIEIASTNTFIQTHVAEHMRGRVLSYYVMAFLGMQPLGGLLIGAVAQWTGAPFTLLAEGLLGIGAVVIFRYLFLKPKG